MMLQEITNKGLGSPFTRGGYIDCCAGISGKKYINSLNTSWKEQMLSESGCSDRKRCLYLRTLVNAVCDHGGGDEEFFIGAELHLHRRKRVWRVGCTAKNG